ncbi:MAG: cytochrome C oxidase subunit IV family protein [Candidatus Rokubacteria bacterium]|nr:cytochrome C oxidase subunit IV family protein [Candidatus Rokubacteria bacterium]
MATTDKHPNYMAIFWWLAVLTVIELGVIFLPTGKVTIGVLLCGLAVAKAALVAMYFMHLRFETRTLGLIAMTPLTIATLLVLLLLPDGFAVDHRTQATAPAASVQSK